jgi:hypothetical protein
LRLIFANREGAAALATLQLGEVSLRPIPSMESIYIYESLIESCKSLLPAQLAEAKPLAANSAVSTARPQTSAIGKRPQDKPGR